MEGLVTCRAGFESVVAGELESLEIEVLRIGKRAVFFRTDLGGIYRANMGLHSAISVLLPLRTFNARDYKLLYFQARRTNWHQLFTVDKTVRIDVNGHSSKLTHTQYVTHRIKDGIVDTFRKMTDGQRPTISKDDPDIHIVAHLNGKEVTLCIDTSGIPLFKRGYRKDKGEAPLKEDVAAGILQLSGLPRDSGTLLDPMCGSGTFLFEAFLLASRIAPNLERKFGFESMIGYDADLHAAEKLKLRDRVQQPGCRFLGNDIDAEVVAIAKDICSDLKATDFIEFENKRFQDMESSDSDVSIVSNPPYGIRLGEEGEMEQLYREFGVFLKRNFPGSSAAIFSANRSALKKVGLKPQKSFTLFNGALEGLLGLYEIRERS